MVCRDEMQGAEQRPVNIVLGVTGGIAAYKAVHLLRLLREAGHQVQVVPTKAALKFVGKATWEALSGQPVHRKVFDDVVGVEHVKLGQQADLVVVVPATADLLAKAATGQADDLLTATLLVAECPVVFAPAMHTQMWEHPATQANVATLISRGVKLIGPASGRLTGRDSGIGRMVEPDDIFSALGAYLGTHDETAVGKANTSDNDNDETQSANPLSIVITAGGTREPLDPARFISNRSTGKQGIALADAALDRNADVTLICANIPTSELASLKGRATIIEVESAADLEQAVTKQAATAHVIIMAAAVADYRPAQPSASKIKKQAGKPLTIELKENPDILAELCRNRKPGQLIVGFAAETGDNDGSVLDYGKAKALRKGADLLAVNEVGANKGFGTPTNEVWLLDKHGTVIGHEAGTKRQVADAILTAVAQVASATSAGSGPESDSL